MKNKHIILVGFMGAGKTSIGKRLTKETGLPMADTDQMIEKNAGMPISEIFATAGEAKFRNIESQVLQALKYETAPRIISTGGGLPLREENRAALKAMGKVVFLRVQAETVLKRLAGDTTRPLLSGPDKEQKVKELLTYRNPIYAQAAHVTVDVDGKAIEQIVQEILEKIKE